MNFSGNGQESSSDKTTIRVLSFNVHHGAGANGHFDPSNAVSVIKEADPDLVALQEIDSKTSRVNGKDLASELAQATGMYGIFGKAIDFAGGEYGQVILSTNSFLSTRKIDLPGQPQKEPRIAVEVFIELRSGDTIQFLATHLDHRIGSSDRVPQAQKLNQLKANGLPAILAGDLNDIPGSKTIDLLESEWNSAYSKGNPQPTFPSASPEKKIDYVMFHPKERWRVLENKVICNETASDHCAVLVTLELLPE